MDQQPVIPINIILASNSPRRAQLLQDAGVQFRVFIPTEPVDETLDADLLAQPEEAAKKLAERKAGAAVQEVLAQNPVGLCDRCRHDGRARWRDLRQALFGRSCT